MSKAYILSEDDLKRLEKSISAWENKYRLRFTSQDPHNLSIANDVLAGVRYELYDWLAEIKK